MIKREKERFFNPLKSKIKSIENQWFFILLIFINLIFNDLTQLLQ